MSAPQLAPRRYDVAEPIRRVFNPSRIADALTIWGGPRFFWETNTKGGIGAYLEGTSRNLCDAINVSIESDDFESVALLDFLAAASVELHAEFAYLHRTFDEEVSDRDFYKAHVMPFCQGLSAPDFDRGLPGVAWAMCFGKELVERVGTQRFRSAPVFATKELANGAVLLQVTERLESYQTDYKRFRERADDLVKHVDGNLFAYQTA